MKTPAANEDTLCVNEDNAYALNEDAPLERMKTRCA
jgi:hypothetical protein